MRHDEMGFCCRGRRRRRHGTEAAEAATQRWCEEAIGATGGPPRTPAARPALETRTPLHSRAPCPSPLEVELGAAPSPSTVPAPPTIAPAVLEVELGATRVPTPCRYPAVRRVYALHAARRRPVATVLDAARTAPSTAAGAPTAPPPPSTTPAARRTVDLDAAAAFAYTPPPPRTRVPLAEVNGASRGASAKRRPYRGLSTPALVADLERTLGARLRPRHATVQKARRENGGGYEGWLKRHFASPPPRRRSRTSPPRPDVWV